MINEIKEQLLEDPEKIIELLQCFEFSHIHHNLNEIRFARDENGGQNIRIRLKNNDYLVVNDYVTSDHLDIFSYIIKEKKTNFYEVIHKTKEILGLNEFWQPKKRKQLFGGIYNNILKPSHIILDTYDVSELDQYEKSFNIMFLKDGIGFKTQEFFDLRFSSFDNRIIIPIKNEFGELVGAKGRYNGEPSEEIPKYIYPIPVMSSQVLFGYSENYEFLYNADIVYVGEAEKFVMQCHSMDIRNCVALGSHSLSLKQAELLIQLCPNKIVFMLDEGLDLNETIKNAQVLKSAMSIFYIEIFFFDYTICKNIKSKQSPSDGGIELWHDATVNCIKNINEIMKE